MKNNDIILMNDIRHTESRETKHTVYRIISLNEWDVNFPRQLTVRGNAEHNNDRRACAFPLLSITVIGYQLPRFEEYMTC